VLPSRVRAKRKGFPAARSGAFAVSFLSSCAIHIAALLSVSVMVRDSSLRRQHFFPVRLVELPDKEDPALLKRVEAAAEIEKPRPKVERARATPPSAIPQAVKPEEPNKLAASLKEVPAAQTNEPAPENVELPPSLSSNAAFEGGGSDGGLGSSFDEGEIGVVPGTGTPGGGGGTAASGLGRSSAAPGLPGQPVLKTNRQAKPIQTARAVYPPMALRMGLESDVTLRIEVDTEGKVIRAEIVKSGGSGFDEEALKAVKQSRFEPARRDHRNVPAEFIYVYRFRLRR
jgi:protein TonB